jgi:hypothetical protein
MFNEQFAQQSVLHERQDNNAADAGESGAIPSIFLRLSIFPVGRRPAARPSAGTPQRACGAYANRWALVERF